MRTIQAIRFILMLAVAVMLGPVLAAPKAEVDEIMSHDGLSKISVKGLDLVYARPGATLAGYDKISLEPVQVAFSKSWDPKRTGSNFKLSTEERENIRTGVAQIVNEEFVRELQSKGNYKVVKDAGPDVLRVKVDIINLYVNAPDTMTPGRTRTYTVSAGEMTLVMEMFDSETGEVLARVVDRRESRGSEMISFSNRVTNTAEAARIASSWARILRNSLDKAHGIGKK